MKLLGRAWRSLATILCFITFALGGLLMGAFFIPLVQVLWRDESKRRRAGRRIVHISFRLFVLMMEGTGVLRVRFEGLERLQAPGALLVSNHPTLIDFVLLGSVLPQADCIVKSGLWKDWFKRWPLMLAGYIRNDHGEETLALCRRSLDAGNSLIIFPEGTRTLPGLAPKFQRGAAQLAVRLRQAITPVLIESTPSNLHKGGKWYLAPPHQVHMRVRPLADVGVESFVEGRPGQPALAARDLSDQLQRIFIQELSGASDRTGD
jgi:1-acyl-sn-glycerol-3-phosphate acyltransferase